MNQILILIISFFALFWAANHLVTGARGLAFRFNCSPFVAGLTIIALGTSAPEIAIALWSSIKEQNDLAIGNVIGSNIANIGLVLGVTILIKPGTLNYNLLKKTYPVMIIAMLFVYSMILDDYLGKIDGCLFLIAGIGLMAFFIYRANHEPRKDIYFNQFKQAGATGSLQEHLLNVILGLLVLPISAKYIINSAVFLASWSGMSELTISLTVIAIGTTLPELATAITAALKGEEDIALGTILGSNVYNLLLILAFPALINSSKVNTIILRRDMPVLIALTLLLFFLNHHYKKNLSSWHGGILILVYVCYIVSLILKAFGP